MATGWHATHEIVAESPEVVYAIPVMLVDGICYTEREWIGELSAEWGCGFDDAPIYYGDDPTYQTTTNTIREVQR